MRTAYDMNSAFPVPCLAAVDEYKATGSVKALLALPLEQRRLVMVEVIQDDSLCRQLCGDSLEQLRRYVGRPGIEQRIVEMVENELAARASARVDAALSALVLAVDSAGEKKDQYQAERNEVISAVDAFLGAKV